MTSLDYKDDARDLHAFKELRFFLSHAVQLEIRCSIARLELPLIADFLLGDYSQRRWNHKTVELAGGTNDPDGGTDGIEDVVRRIVSETELVATAQIFTDGQPMHAVPMRYDPKMHAIIWDDTICFPLRYRDLDQNSRLVVTLWGAKDRLVGVASMRFFDSNASLVMGLQKQPFRFTSERPFAWDPAAPPSGKEPRSCVSWRGAVEEWDSAENKEYDDIVAQDDWGFRLERMREKYRLNAMDRAGWLDPVSLARVDQLVAASADPVEIKRHQAYQTKAEAELRGSPSVVIEMPCFAHPIIHDERPYPGVPGSGGGGGGGGGGGAGGGTGVGSAGGSAVTGIPDGSAASPDDALVGAGGGTGGGSNAYTSSRSRDGTVSPPVGVMSGGGLAPRNGSGEGAAMGMAGAGGRAWGDSDLMAGGGVEAFLLVSDYEMEEDNPVEHKYRKLAHDQLRGLVDHELKPNRDERQRIDTIVATRQDHLKMEDRDLIWKFRYCLTDNKRALTKLLLSVDWGVDSEVAQVEGLLAQWARQAPIDAPDALKLLGRERTFQAEVVRRFAVDALRRASDEELLAFLLQLVQALRYQAVGGSNGSTGADGVRNASADGEGGVGGGGGATAASALAASSGASAGGPAGGGGGHGETVSPLAQFLIERACKSLELANFFYWYLRVDLEDATHGHIYRGVQAAFKRVMKQTPESARVMDMLLAQDDYVQGVARAHKEACELNAKKQLKDERLRELLKAPHLRRVPSRAGGGNAGSGGGCVPMPLDPTVQITGLEPSSAFLFKSALYPCVIEFTVKRDGVHKPSGGMSLNESTASAASETTADPMVAPIDGSTSNSSGSISDSTKEESGSSSGMGVSGLAGGTAAAVAAAVTGPGGNESQPDADDGTGDNLGRGSSSKRGGGGGVNTSGSSWLGQGVMAMGKESSYKVIIKSGDDLRQDQLIMQMISLMDSLLKRVNLDLRVEIGVAPPEPPEPKTRSRPMRAASSKVCQENQTSSTSGSGKPPVSCELMPYAILATGPRHGMVQFVSGSQPVSAVMSSYNGSILEYLRHHNPDSSAPNGVRPSAMQTFVKSTAGYCVITYLLGIGDRHLDNLMLMPAGNLFHIDFGYIFGRDPKPMAPPFRFTREMAEAMGGVASEDYRLFKTYCCQAYNWLRKSANLILNLLSLMTDAGISELSADPVAVLAKVEERFRLDLTDEMAEHFFVSLIGQSLQAFAPRVMEVMHQFAVSRR